MTECPILCECVVFIKTNEKASSLLNECSEFGIRSAIFSRSGKSAVHLVCCADTTNELSASLVSLKVPVFEFSLGILPQHHWRGRKDRVEDIFIKHAYRIVLVPLHSSAIFMMLTDGTTLWVPQNQMNFSAKGFSTGLAHLAVLGAGLKS
ncbi:hypothetical protein CEXT_681091 [Caerostris extrusa]|uniref:Uncharacterized protein n=1 Tax=Caerostris extrusa TaxID=172846 RepID=A0AAV4WPC6_CAEEX|nr:hypothetical protein CEXT_681091 [Caerostris extrusa]